MLLTIWSSQESKLRTAADGDGTDVHAVDFIVSTYGYGMDCHGCKLRVVAHIIAAHSGDALISNNLVRLYITTVILFVIN